MDSIPQYTTRSAQELKEQAAKLQEQAAQIEKEAREKAHEEERLARIKKEEEVLIANFKKNGPQVREVVKNVENVLGITMAVNFNGSKTVKAVVDEYGGLHYTGKYGSTNITITVNPTVHLKNGMRYEYDTVTVGVIGMRAEWYSDRRRFNKLYKVTSWDKAIDHFIQKATEIKTREDAVVAAEKAKADKKQTTEEAIKACFEGVPFDVKIEQNYHNRSVSFSRSLYEPTGTYSVTLYKPGTYERVTGYGSVYVDKDGIVRGTFTQTVDIKEHYHASKKA